MSFDSLLPHTCTVERAVKTQDEYRNTRRTYSPHLTRQICRLIERRQFIRTSESAQLVPVTRYTLLLPFSVDVREDDRFTSFDYGAGEVAGETWAIVGEIKRRSMAGHHMSIELQRVESTPVA